MRTRNALTVTIVSAMLLPLWATTAQAEGDDATASSDDPTVDKPDLSQLPVIESTTGSYVVVMLDDPLIVEHDQDELTAPAAEADAAELVASHDEVLADVGISTDEKVQDFTNALNGFSATLTYTQAVKVSGHPGVAAVLPDELRQLTTDSSGEYMQLDVKGGAWRSGLTGEDVIVGVIDSGIWPEHPSFDGKGYSAMPPLPDALAEDDSVISSGCEFGNTAHNPNDKPFTCNGKLIGARQMMQTYRSLTGAEPDEFDSARDDDGHGTHTASTAAGNANVTAKIFGKNLGKISGVAPRARIIAYKALGNLGGYSSDLAAAIDQAVADGVDVINYSVGGGPGLLGADAISFLFAADAGVFVATSAGNAGDGPATIGGPADNPWLTTVAASTQDRFFRGTITLTDGPEPGHKPRHGAWAIWQWWQNWFQYQRSMRFQFGASITQQLKDGAPLIDAADAGNDLCLVGEFDPAVDLTGAVVLCRRGGNGRAEKGLAVYEAGGAGMILYNNTDTDNLFTDNHWVPTVHVDYSVGVKVKQYIADHDDPYATITDTAKKTSINYDPSVTIFSSRGPNPSAGDVIKPDVTAPGLQILAGNSPFPDPGVVPGELFQAIAGTSMSSPQVAGLFALLKQAHPDWSAAAAKSALMTTADPNVRDNDRVSRADPFDTGSGHVKPGKPGNAGSMFQPGVVFEAGFLDYLAFLCGNGDLCVGVPGIDPSDLNLASIGVADLAGTQTVTRTITSVASKPLTWTASVEAPPGYDVSVNPSTITLQPGEPATYQVTIANNGGGAVGVWSFGSMTWSASRGYVARSPIAVKAAEIAAPLEIGGAGTDGALSVPIQFGYTGNYAAASSGLVPNAPRTGEISQDPDTNPFTADDGPGLVQIDVPVSGASVVRWEMQEDDALGVDIDIYVFDSAGNFVAQSTAGGTHELIELHAPADDVYSVFLHGWAVPPVVDPFTYTLDEWVVPAVPGSLAITQAPTAANVGQFATVDVAWTGATPGRSLGAVTHTRDGVVIATTTVVVDA